MHAAPRGRWQDGARAAAMLHYPGMTQPVPPFTTDAVNKLTVLELP